MFIDRVDAGRQLAEALAHLKDQPVVVYALPRGGVVLGVEVAKALNVPLDLIVVRKIGHPQQPEYAVGAITEHGEMVLNPAEAGSLNPQWIEQAAIRELDEARRRREIFQARSRIHPEGKIAIVVDDGLATGLTMEAALRDLRKMHPARVIVAVPVAAAETVERLRSQADDVVALQVPSHFGAVGAFYKDFEQLTDADIVALLNSLERTA